MPKGEPGLDDASALLDLITGAVSGKLNEPFNLTQLPRKMMEIERKYCLTQTTQSIGMAITNFMGCFGRFLEDQKIVVESFITFVGVDQYFIIQRNNKESVFRYRVGANRPAQLTVKFQTEQGSNLVRGEINLNIRYEEPDKVRAFMAVVCGLADSYQIFAVQQSGNIWITRDSEGNSVEVVVYKTARITPPEKLEVFVEIEPLNSENIPGVIEIIEKYEKALQLSDFTCKESIAELFRPNNKAG